MVKKVDEIKVNIEEFKELIKSYPHLEGNERWVSKKLREYAKKKHIQERKKREARDYAQLLNIIKDIKEENPNFPEIVEDLFYWVNNVSINYSGEAAYYINDNISRAIIELNELWGLNPENGDIDDALECLENCLRDLPHNPEA
jgi:hypothetical protein